MFNRPTIAKISLDNLIYNFKTLSALAPKSTRTMGVVKANAYGHGALEVAHALEAVSCDYLGVAILEEALALREGGIRTPIMILGGVVLPEQAEAIVAYDITPVICDIESARRVNSVASGRGVKKNIHIKIDTGMGRIGLQPKDLASFFEELKGLDNLFVEGLLSHYADMEVEDKSYSKKQLDTFLESAALVRSMGFDPGMLHMSNSAAIVDFNDSHMDMIRMGLMLYGVYPAQRFLSKITLKPVMEFKSAITHIKQVGEGFSVSYGRKFVTLRDSVIATIPAGYADGIPRRLSNTGSALVRGVRVPIVGAVCMDMTMLDITNVGEVEPGDEVTLIGTQGNEEITALEVAKKVGTISYEILCNIGPRVPRVYE